MGANWPIWGKWGKIIISFMIKLKYFVMRECKSKLLLLLPMINLMLSSFIYSQSKILLKLK